MADEKPQHTPGPENEHPREEEPLLQPPPATDRWQNVRRDGEITISIRSLQTIPSPKFVDAEKRRFLQKLDPL